jgi:hypothetical protein
MPAIQSKCAVHGVEPSISLKAKTKTNSDKAIRKKPFQVSKQFPAEACTLKPNAPSYG